MDDINLLAELDLRRRELRMSYAQLAARSGVSTATTVRVLSGRYPKASWENIVALASSLGMSLSLTPTSDPVTMRERQARKQAERIVKLTQGSSGLEGQALDADLIDQMIRKTSHSLLNRRGLWREQ